MARGYGLHIGLGVGGTVIFFAILIFLLICLRMTQVPARLARYWLLIPLATLVLVSAAGMGTLASLILRCLLDDYDDECGVNYLSFIIAYFQLIVGVHALVAAWLTFWHSIKFTPTTQHTAASNALLAFLFSIIPTGLAIKAVIVGGFNTINMAAAITTWALSGLLLILAFSLVVSPSDKLKLETQSTTYYAPPPMSTPGPAAPQGHGYPAGAAYQRPVAP